MKTSSKSTLNAILKHREYFDQKLVEIVCELRNQNDDLLDTLALKNIQIHQMTHSSVTMTNKIADLKAENDNLMMAKKESEATIDDMLKEMEKMRKEIDRLYIENQKAIDEVKRNRKLNDELLKKINKLESSNSTNSNIPTSGDILSHSLPKAKKPCNSRITSNRKRGGQTGHKLHKSQVAASADEIRNMYVKKAPTGAEAVRDNEGNVLYFRTQEVDLQIKTRIIETRYHITEEGDELPADLARKYRINPVTYSTHFKSSMIYLNQRGTIPYERLSEIVAELSDHKIIIRPSTLVNWSNEFLNKSRKPADMILTNIKADKIVNVDETSVKINGKLNWIHTITSDTGTYYVVTESRYDKENGPMSLLDDYEHILVHDHFKSYYHLDRCKHSECNAHTERYLQQGIDFDNSEACKNVKERMHKALKRKHDLQKAGIFEMDSSEIEEVKSELLKIMKDELIRYDKDNENIPKYLEPDYIKLFRRMIEYIDEHLYFLADFDVPYTNNAAERSCRKVKTKKNVSHQFVSKDMADSYARAMTIIETARQNHKSVLSELENILR